jgi:hydroxymethylglutaryl-CoA reductase
VLQVNDKGGMQTEINFDSMLRDFQFRYSAATNQRQAEQAVTSVSISNEGMNIISLLRLENPSNA